MTNSLTYTDKAKRLERARYLLTTVRHAAMATVGADGSPHNTPYRFMYAPDLSRVYWGSHPNSVHSRNIARTGQLYIVLFEADKRGGLYIKAEDGHITEGDELLDALGVHNAIRKAAGETPIDIEYYQGTSPQRMWSARPTTFWVNGSIKDADEHIIEDIRIEITSQDLLK
jgi:hypothetical protein